MKKIYIFVFTCFILTFIIVSSSLHDSKVLIISRDVRGETKNMIKSYYISQRNESDYMPLAEDNLSKDYSVYSKKLGNEKEKIHIQVVKGYAK